MNRSSEYKYINPSEVRVIGRRNNKETVRTVVVSVGGTYVIDPLNPLTKKNRGRKCKVVQFKGTDAVIQFEGTKQNARVPLDDLSGTSLGVTVGRSRGFDLVPRDKRISDQ
jgi:hypothetical protein